MRQIHDKGYKRLFKNKTIFRQLLETFVTENWVKDLDFDNCERVEKSFISGHYKETASDIIYKIKLKQKDIFIVILVEFKSKSCWSKSCWRSLSEKRIRPPFRS